MNAFLFHCGMHNEHHDLPGVAWFHLPTVRRVAADHYDGLHSCRSWTGLLWRFLTDRDLTIGHRVVRGAATSAEESERP